VAQGTSLVGRLSRASDIDIVTAEASLIVWAGAFPQGRLPANL
jgi:hypothetical protein